MVQTATEKNMTVQRGNWGTPRDSVGCLPCLRETSFCSGQIVLSARVHVFMANGARLEHQQLQRHAVARDQELFIGLICSLAELSMRELWRKEYRFCWTPYKPIPFRSPFSWEGLMTRFSEDICLLIDDFILFLSRQSPPFGPLESQWTL